MNEEENQNEENHNEENQNENGSSKEKESLKKVVTRRQPAKAKINIKTEAQKKEASSVAPTMLSKLWQQFISFQVMAVLTAEGKTQDQKALHDAALGLYKKQVKALVQKFGYYSHIDEFEVGEITEEQMNRTKGLDLLVTGEKVWKKGKDVTRAMETYLALEDVYKLLKKHSRVLNNLRDEESPSSKPDDKIEATFEADSGDTDGKNFLMELLMASQPKTDGDDVEVLTAPTVKSVEYIIVKYFFVLADICGYTNSVISERNVVVRYIYPQQVKNVSRSDIERKRKLAAAQESLESIEALNDLEKRESRQLKDYVASLSACTNEINTTRQNLKDADLLDLSEEERTSLKMRIRELSANQQSLRAQYEQLRSVNDAERVELEKKKKLGSDLSSSFNTTTPSSSNKQKMTPPLKRQFMP